jgi:hypothetical protein
MEPITRGNVLNTGFLHRELIEKNQPHSHHWRSRMKALKAGAESAPDRDLLNI